MVDTYSEQVKKVAAEYADRIMAILEAVKQELVKAGLQVNGPEDVSGDEYQWSLCARRPGTGPTWLTDVAVTICESQEYQGDDEGINFQLRAQAHKDGESTVLGEYSPLNFTPDVWVSLDDPEAISARLSLIEDVPASAIVQPVLDYLLGDRRRPEPVQDTESTVVIFRRYRTGAKEVLALFPEVDAGHGLCSSYIHVGQHGAANYTYVVGLTRPAKLIDPDVIGLKAELEEIGYKLVVRRRRSYR